MIHLAGPLRSRPSGAIALALLTVLLPGPGRAEEPPVAGLARKSLKLADGRPAPLSAPKGGALALVFSSTECPISNGFSPTLNALAAQFPREKLTLVAVFVDPDRSDADLVAHAKE